MGFEMSLDLETLKNEYNQLAAKHAALDQMFADAIRSNHDLRTNIVLRDMQITELANKNSELQDKVNSLVLSPVPETDLTLAA